MNRKKYETIFFITALILSTVLTLIVFRPYLTLLAFGGVLAIVTRPLYRSFLRLFKSEVSAAFLTVLFTAVVIVLPLAFFLAAIAGELVSAFSGLRGQLVDFSVPEYLAKILPQDFHNQIPQMVQQLLTLVSGLAQTISSNLVGIFSNVFSTLFGFLVMLITVYYLLKDGTRIKQKLIAISPLDDKYDEIMFSRISTAVRAVMGGVLVMGIIKAVLAGFFFWLFGVPAPLFWGALTGIASFVPVFGTSLTTIPAAVFLLLTGHVAAAIGLLIVSAAIIGTVDNFLQPKLVESKTKIHPLLILLSILGGLEFYGFSGFILGPLTLAVTMALFSLYEKQFKKRIMGS